MLDLDRRGSKFEKEQEKRRLEAKKKLDQENRLKQVQLKREQELQLLAQKRKEEEEQLRLQQEVAEKEEYTLTGGIKCKHILQPYAIPEEAEQNNDKLLLPEDCLTELTAQDVFSRGQVIIFRLTATTNRPSSQDGSKQAVVPTAAVSYLTHAGVREFSAPSGMIGLPAKVLACLGGDLSVIPTVSLQYVQLAKATAVTLQPRSHRFYADNIIPIKRMLEENLQHHTALSIEDVLTVWYRGAAYVMKVVQLQSAGEVSSYGSLVETDLEVQLEVSEEHQVDKQQQEKQQTIAAGTGHRLGSSSLTAVASSSVKHQLSQQPESTAIDVVMVIPATAASSSSSFSSSVSVSVQRLLASYTQLTTSGAVATADQQAASTATSENSFTVKIKLPDNRSITHRCRSSDPLYSLFQIVQQALGINDLTTVTRLQLTRRYPAQSWRLGKGEGEGEGEMIKMLKMTIAEAGLEGKAETLFASLV